MNEDQKSSIVYQVRSWLGCNGIEYFKEVKEIHGTLDAYWMEPVIADMIPQYIPRSISAQEGRTLIQFMRTLDQCDGWTEKDFEEQWIPILEESIEDQNTDNTDVITGFYTDSEK